MSSAIPLVKSVQLQVVIESGSMKGQVFSLKQSRLTIGREADNDIVIADDAKMSRKHVEILSENNVQTIKNLSQKNPIWLDGKEIQTAMLQKTSKLQIGTTVFQLRVEVNALPVRTPAVPSSHLKLASAPPAPPSPQQSISARASAHEAPKLSENKNRAPSTDSKKTNFYIIVGAIGLLFLWLMVSGSGSNRKSTQLRTRDQVIMDLEKSEQAIKEVEKKQEDTGQQTLQYKTAQEHYIKGFRDYRQGQYARAMSSFQAALSFYSQHELAKKYLTLARRKFDEIVQFNMIQGKRYKGKNNFRLCKSAYANVMIMVKDPADPIYREAKQYYNECSLLFEAKY